jgi:hypothetical protein
MNFKIERVQGGESEVVLNLCGRIQSEQLDTIKESIEEETRSIVLDLTQITLADRPSVIFLAKCELRGIEIRNAPTFLAKWIAKERKQMPTETHKSG